MTGSTSARPTQPGTKTYPNAALEAASTQWHPQDDRAPHEPPSGQRVEPSLDESGFPSAASSAYEKLHGLGPDFGEYHTPPRSRMRRLVMMACVFIVGAGVGLAAAWWFHRPPVGAPLAIIPSTQVRTLPTVPDDGKRASAIRGISPSELPYDGAPPPTTAQSPAASTASQIPSVVPGQSSGSSGATPQGDSGNKGVRASAGQGEQDQPSSKLEVQAEVAPVKAVQEPRDASADDAGKSAKAAKQGSASVASSAPKRKSVTRTDREIERIRRQVDEELKKKTEQGRGLGEARTGGAKGAHADGDSTRTGSGSASVSRVAANRAMLAKCDSKTNFIQRELCRWQVCNGSWGRNGCPSYQKQASAY